MDAFKAIQGARVVAKIADSSGGHGVYIGSRQEVLSMLPNSFPLLVQEFMDTSCGIPGYTNGAHDLRVEIGGGEIWGCNIRIPKPGTYKANVAQGGSRVILTHKDVPPMVKKLVEEIDAYFTGYPRFYALDFAYTSDGWKMIEANTRRVGLIAASVSSGSKYTLYKLANYLLSSPDIWAKVQ